MPFHLYFHLPYCRRRCPYCDFYKKVPKDGDLERLATAIRAELSLATRATPWATGPVQTAYFGGGTPSLQSPAEIASILTETTRLFRIEADAEVTLEANPGTVTLDSLTRLRESGVNRLSLGGQSFSERKLAILYRDHTAVEIEQAIVAARASGFSNLSLDLIFGLPGESISEWQTDLDRALALDPEHVSLYNLEYHEATPLYRWREQRRVKPLDEDLEFELYISAHERLTSAGYEHYEVSNFAKPGLRSRHNSAYWTGAPYLGLGPSAHSFDGERRRFANVADVDQWHARIERGELPISREWISSPRELIEEWLSLALRRCEGIGYDAAVARLGAAAATTLWRKARTLPADSCAISDQALRLSARGWFRENSVLLWLFEALPVD
ncbi:radical SAM family heme chaperone HemW [candidate division KSB1 bacterium]|nr:radical SAM family heme chaperone HemW [candidate division KSB1 bacterium]